MMIKVSVITVNYKAWNPLKRCLDALKALGQNDFSWEVIVVDNGSEDQRLGEFREAYPEFTFIENGGNYGFANGNNLGAQYARGEYVMFLNSDTVANVESFRAMLELAGQYDRISVVSAQQTNLSGKNENPYDVFPSLWTVNGLIKSIYLLMSGKKRKMHCTDRKVIFPDWVSGSLILMKKSFFDQIGGWDEDFWLYCEDIDLCKRVEDRGGIIALQCAPSITHQHGGTTRRSIRSAAFCKAMVIISRHIYFRKHFSGMYHFFLQFFLVINTLLFSKLIPALAGLVFFFVGSMRKNLYLYLNILTYYFKVIRNHSWLIDIRKVHMPD